MDSVPETIANFAFLPSGIAFSYIFFLKEQQYATTTVWPYIVAVFTALATATALMVSKFNSNRVNFSQFYYLIFANVCSLVAGILFWIFGTHNDEFYIVYIMAVGIGITHIAGLSYISVRTTKHERSARIGLSYFTFFLGFAISMTVLDQSEVNYGIIFTCCSAFLLVVLVSNEVCQFMLSDYDYKRSRENYLNELNDLSSVFEKKVQKDISPLDLLKVNLAAGGWKSTNNLIDNSKTENKQGHYGTIWLIYIICINLIGFSMFYEMFINLALLYITGFTISYLIFWVLVAGTLIGAAQLFFIPTRYFFIGIMATILVLFIPLLILLWQDSSNAVGILFLVIYFFFGMCSSIPDTSVIELSHLRNTEVALAAGFGVKIIPIAVLQYVNFVNNLDLTKNMFTVHIIVVIVICIVCMLVVYLHLPDTFRRTLHDIQNYLDSNRNYTVVQKVKTLPVYPEQSFQFPLYGQHEQFVDSRPQSMNLPTYATPQKLSQQTVFQDTKKTDNRYTQYPTVSARMTPEPQPEELIQRDLIGTMERYDYKNMPSSNIFPRPRLSPEATNTIYRARDNQRLHM